HVWCKRRRHSRSGRSQGTSNNRCPTPCRDSVVFTFARPVWRSGLGGRHHEAGQYRESTVYRRAIQQAEDTGRQIIRTGRGPVRATELLHEELKRLVRKLIALHSESVQLINSRSMKGRGPYLAVVGRKLSTTTSTLTR